MTQTRNLIDENGKEHSVFTGDTLFIGDVGRPDLRENAGSLHGIREERAAPVRHRPVPTDGRPQLRREGDSHARASCVVFGPTLSGRSIATILVAIGALNRLQLCSFPARRIGPD